MIDTGPIHSATQLLDLDDLLKAAGLPSSLNPSLINRSPIRPQRAPKKNADLPWAPHLLRASRQWRQGGNRTADKHDELSPPHMPPTRPALAELSDTNSLLREEALARSNSIISHAPR